MPNPINITNIPPPRVDFIDPRTGLIAREWYRFFLNLFNLTGAGTNEVSLTDLQVGPPLINDVLGELGIVYDQAQIASMMAQYEQAVLNIQNQIDTAPSAPELGTLASQNADNVRLIGFSTSPSPAVPNPAPTGTLYWDGNSTLGVQMNQSVLAKIGQGQFVYVKASAAITKGQLCKHTGAVGGSGVITSAPTSLAMTDTTQIIGVAAQDIALNDFGFVQVAGDLRGFNTTGSSVGETWADGDPLYYNPAYVGSFTKVKPSAPNLKTYIGEVINAGSGGSGSINIHLVYGSTLGGTDSNVQLGTVSDKDLIQYDSTAQYWKNVAASSISIGTATNLAGGAAGSVPYQSGASTTTFLPIGTAAQVLQVNAGATAPEWVSSTGTGNVVRATSPTLVTPILGTPQSGNFSTGTFTWPTFNQNTTGSAGSVANALTFNNSGTGAASGTTFNGSAARTISYNTIGAQPSGTYVTAVTGTAPVVSSGGTTPAISMAAATGLANGYLTSTDWTTFNGKQAALVSGTNIKTVGGNSLLGAGDVGTIGAVYGGTGQTTYTLGDTLYSSAANTLAKLAGNITTTRQFLRQTGTGTVSAAPVWDTVTKTDVGLSNVENTALSTWAGSANITTLGTIGTGTWQGSIVGSTYGGTGINNAGRTLTISTNSGTLSFTNAATTLTIANTGSVSGTNTGDQTITLTGDVTGSGTGSFATTLATVTAAKGGTGQTTYVVGDLLYASATNALSRLADVATGNALISGGVGVAPSWGKIGLTTHVSGTLAATSGGTGQTSYTIGDLLYASSTTALSKLADVATGNALISGGVGVAPSWGKIGLTTHVSGALPVGNGGTGTSLAFTSGSVIFAGTSGVYAQNNAKLYWDNTNSYFGIGTSIPTHTLMTESFAQPSTSGSYANIKIKDSWDYANFPEPGIVFSGYTDATTENALGSVSVQKINATAGDASSKIRFLVSSSTPAVHVIAMEIGPEGYAECNGLTFPATQIPSANANTLDDYEEGDWTPTIAGSTTAGVGTYTIQVGKYTKIGRNVTITGRVTWTAHTGTGAPMRIGGLPFTSINVANAQSGVSFGYINNVAYTAGSTPLGYVNTNSTQIILMQMPSGGGAMANVNMDTAGDYIFSCTYMV